jgi:hypothetical protein
MNRSNRRAETLTILVLHALIACGSDASEGGSGGGTGGTQVTVSTGLPADRTLSSFDDADARRACQALGDGAAQVIPQSELLRAQCASYAIGETAKLNSDGTAININTADCETVTKACQADPASVGVNADGSVADSDCSTAMAGEHVASCEATVAEYETCVNALLGAAKVTLASLTCANAKTLIEDDGPKDLNAADIPACKAFLTKCPSVELTVGIEQ